MALILLLVLVALATEPAVAEKRIALVVGIDKYVNLPDHQQLKKAVNDSKSISSALASQGFQVLAAHNASRIEFIRTWQRFLNQIERGDVVALFFAGHGVEIKGQNFLLPSDMPQVQGGEEEILKAASMSTDDMLEQLQNRGGRLNLVILDACRDNPFATTAGRSIGSSRGLGRVQPASGTFIMYSAGIGQSALDRLSDEDQNGNSVYTRELLPLLQQPGLSLLQIATRVRRRVRERALEVNHKQVPAYYDEVIRDFYLAGKDAGADGGKTGTGGTKTVIETTTNNRNTKPGNDKLACQRAILDDTLEAYEKFLKTYPGSGCRAKIQKLYEAKVEKIHWDKAIAEHTIAGYQRFLIAFDGGIYAGQARDRMQALKQTSQTKKVVNVPDTDVTQNNSSGNPDRLRDLAGYDVFGGDYQTVRNVSLNRCNTICGADQRCRAFTYNKKHRLCFLKETVGTLMPNYQALSAVRQSELRRVRPSNIRVFDNKDVTASDYRMLDGTGFLDCYKACEADRRCRSFAHVKRTATCWLKSASFPARYKKGVRLGIKEN
ncbi:MAG: hypothetical protein HKN11_05215 [Rhizobiales bacterium]|nr:hypothetical protein [Hyphomicrobiales bacterium]